MKYPTFKSNLNGTERSHMLVGYIRTSTAEQNTARQEVLMKELGVEKVFIEKASGKNTQRPELQKLLSFVRKGDKVVVESISRFARNTKDLLNLIEMLADKEVEFVSQKESIDTSTPTGKFMLTVFGAVAELERQYILQRQREGIAIAKQKGKYKGRKRIENDQFYSLYKKWQNKEITATNAIKQLNYSRNTFYRRVKERIKLDNEKED